jgi:hypothetical protein
MNRPMRHGEIKRQPCAKPIFSRERARMSKPTTDRIILPVGFETAIDYAWARMGTVNREREVALAECGPALASSADLDRRSDV